MTAYCTAGHDCSCYLTEEVSPLKSTEFTCTWKIDHYKYIHPGIGKCISTGGSDAFDENTLWKAFLYPDGFDSESYAFISVVVLFNRAVLHLENSPYLLKIFFVDRQGQEIEMHATKERKQITINIVKNFTLKSYLFNQENSRDLLPNGRLTIRFKAYMLGEEAEYKPRCIAAPADRPCEHQDLEAIFNQKKFSDVAILVGERQFYAYKGILANQSPVFAAMFEHDMRENNENVVRIVDMEHGTVEQMLRFIYSGKVENIEDSAYDLLPAADKYEIKKLKDMCEAAMINELSPDNVVRLLIHADKYSAEELKQRALTLFKIHVRKIIDGEDFKKNLFELAPIFPEILARVIS